MSASKIKYIHLLYHTRFMFSRLITLKLRFQEFEENLLRFTADKIPPCYTIKSTLKISGLSSLLWGILVGGENRLIVVLIFLP